jgi:hypothetical protein
MQSSMSKMSVSITRATLEPSLGPVVPKSVFTPQVSCSGAIWAAIMCLGTDTHPPLPFVGPLPVSLPNGTMPGAISNH